jgi:hypothetical protein
MNKKRVTKAIRGLARNRTLKAKEEGRAEKAEDTVKTYLELSDVTTAKAGKYQVELVDGEVKVTSLPQVDYKQIRFLERETRYRVRPEDILTSREADLLQRADKGELPCPACGTPLRANVVRDDLCNGVVLFCGCGFREE